MSTQLDKFILGTVSLPNFLSNTVIGTASQTVDIAPCFAIAQTAAGISLGLPTPTVATLGQQISIVNTGTVSVTVGGVAIGPTQVADFIWCVGGWAVPSSVPVTAIRVNNANTPGLYEVAVTSWTNNPFEFYQDAYLRMDHSGGHFRIAGVSALSISAYGFNSAGANSATFPIVASTAFTPKAAYGNIAVGVFTQISDTAISADYDDIQIYWIQCANFPIRYRITIMGGLRIGATVERWNMALVSANTKITI